MSSIERLWRDHQRIRFPQGCAGREIDGIDLVLLDSSIAGCVSTFLARDRRLNGWRLAVLGQCYRDARHVIPMLEPELRKYFERLEVMAGEILQAVATTHREE